MKFINYLVKLVCTAFELNLIQLILLTLKVKGSSKAAVQSSEGKWKGALTDNSGQNEHTEHSRCQTDENDIVAVPIGGVGRIGQVRDVPVGAVEPVAWRTANVNVRLLGAEIGRQSDHQWR